MAFSNGDLIQASSNLAYRPFVPTRIRQSIAVNPFRALRAVMAVLIALEHFIPVFVRGCADKRREGIFFSHASLGDTSFAEIRAESAPIFPRGIFPRASNRFIIRVSYPIRFFGG